MSKRYAFLSRCLTGATLLGGALLGGALLGGCADSGDASAFLVCPHLEVCSPYTPQGLRFGSQGTALGNYPAGPLALGGRMKLGFCGPTPQRHGFPDFVAQPGRGFSIEEPDDRGVTIRGVARTTFEYLRVTEPDGERLFDKIHLDVLPIEQVALRPLQASGSLVLRAGVETELRFELIGFGLKATSLIDESLTVTASPGLTLTQPEQESARSWDVYQALAEAPGTYPLEVTAGGQLWPLTLEVVEPLDAVEPAPSASPIKAAESDPCAGFSRGERNTLFLRL